MGAGHDRRLRRIAALAAGVTTLPELGRPWTGAARLLGPAHEQIASLAVEICQRDAAYAALLRPADLAQFHQARPQSVMIHAEIGAVGGGHAGSIVSKPLTD